MIVIVTAIDAYAQEDRRFLVAMGQAEIVRFSSGAAAVDFAAHNEVALALVDSEVGDMPLAACIAALRTSRPGEMRPVVAISARREEDFVLGLISAGCCGLVVRPFDPQALERHVAQGLRMSAKGAALQATVNQAQGLMAEGRFEDAIDVLSLTVGEDEDMAEVLFFEGCKFLMEKRWSDAIAAFNQALEQNQTFIKAYEGLAAAYKGKGDMERYQHYLQKAAEEYAKINKFNKVKEIFVEILRHDVNAPNPYNTLGIRLRQNKQYKEALQAYMRALELSPQDENIYYNMAKAYLCDRNIEKALECLRQCLSIAADHAEAIKLLNRLTGEKSSDDSAPSPIRLSLGG